MFGLALIPSTVLAQASITGVVADRNIRHVYIRPRTPHLNGKVERSHRVDAQEFYQLLDKDGITDDIHLFNDKLREWEDYCNTTGHTGVGRPDAL
jgi:transposase InsO family protein